ncbi:MAG: alpha/beta fold hydrolase [Armatimonadetes bacterium]|nr:alpha/beta fold hydrolase [Armatimonadota bacterium]
MAVQLAIAQQPGDVKIEEKSFTSREGVVYKYDLGTIYVPENRDDPNSRVIGVGFARFRSTASSPQAPAMFILPGGPGSSYLARMKSSSSQRERLAEELARFLPFCDVVYVDQRGFSEHGDVLLATMSAPKRPTDRALTEEDWTAAFETFARETVAQYAETNVDLRGYTVKECANDVADLRKALGYDKIMLNGTSFGSQWSFAVMRLHPEIVARALLSGVEPLNHGYDMPSYVFAAVQRMWRTIDEDESFKPYLPPGGMAEAARVVIERLERGEFVIQGEAQSNGEKSTIGVYGPADFPWSNPTRILDLYHGHTEIWQRQAERGFEARTRSVDLIGPLIDTSLGVTPERRHRMWTDPATRYLGRGFAPGLATAEIWPSADVGDDFRTPVLSEIPVVFAQGDWDTKTPLENTFEIAPFFVNSRVIVAERGGHGVLRPIALQLPEVWAEIEEFLRTGDMDGIPARVRLAPSRRFRPPRFPAPGGILSRS